MIAALDLELVDLALAEIRDEQLPDSGGAAVAHGVPAAIPVIEVAGHADASALGAQTAKCTPETLVSAQVGTQPLVVAVVCSFSQEVKVEIGQHRPEQVGIDELPVMPFVVLDLEPVRERLCGRAKTA